jgi:hypothetical protein
MSLIKGTLWVKERFKLGSRPSKDAVIAWIESGEVPGVLLGGEPYVDAEQFDLSLTAPPNQGDTNGPTARFLLTGVN